MSIANTEIVKVRDKWGHILCSHGRLRHYCKECGGASICEHGRVRWSCKECGGRQICEHGRQHNFCKECGGASVCKHSRKRHQCKECGGSSFCEHGRLRSVCKECGGSEICEHGKRRYTCKECRPASAYKQYRTNAKRRGHLFEISFEEYQNIVKQPCRYCGARNETNGIDQVVAGEGYTLANAVPCCKKCNYFKNDYSEAEFLEHCARIIDFQRFSL